MGLTGDDLIRLDSIQPKPLTWLWRPRLALGRLSLLIGHPGQGKTVVACDMSARVSRSLPWPDGQPCEGGTVFFFEAEDDLAEIIVPRLLAAGADMTNIFARTDRTLSNLESLMRQYHPRLVVLSPLNTYLPTIDTWKDQVVRRVLQPLADLAASLCTAIVGIMHPPKTRYDQPIHAIVGSIAFGAVARSVLAVEKTHDGLYVLENIKQNLSLAALPLGYRFVQDHDVAQIVWEAVANGGSLSSADLERRALAQACEYLQMVLDDGPVASKTVINNAKKEGIAERTLVRARLALGVIARPVYCGEKSYWEMRLPGSHVSKNAKCP